jgi:hypothetical protein
MAFLKRSTLKIMSDLSTSISIRYAFRKDCARSRDRHPIILYPNLENIAFQTKWLAAWYLQQIIAAFSIQLQLRITRSIPEYLANSNIFSSDEIMKKWRRYGCRSSIFSGSCFQERSLLETLKYSISYMKIPRESHWIYYSSCFECFSSASLTIGPQYPLNSYRAKFPERPFL